MAYLQSHRGDYLAGHQGGLPIVGALAGGLIKKLGGKALGWLGRRTGAQTAAAVGAGLALPSALPRIPHPTFPTPGGGRIRPTALLPGGMPAYTPGPGQIPKGYRLNKTGYHLKDGTYIPPGTKLVRNRRRNFANGRALNRAISRVQGFERMVKRSRKSLRSLSRI